MKFKIPEVCKVRRLKDGLNILEMFHGPTYAFKDLAMSCLGQFMGYFLKRSGEHVIILVGKFYLCLCIEYYFSNLRYLEVQFQVEDP